MLKGILLFSINTCMNNVLWMSFCLMNYSSCYIIVVLVFRFVFPYTTLRLCVNLPCSEYYNAMAVSIERLLAGVLKITSCVCVFTWVLPKRWDKLWKLRRVPARDYVRVPWAGGLPSCPCRRGAEFPKLHLLCMCHICSPERWYFCHTAFLVVVLLLV